MNREHDDILARVTHIAQGAQADAAPDLKIQPPTDLGNGERLDACLAGDARHSSGTWYLWNERAFAEDRAGELHQRVNAMVREMHRQYTAMAVEALAEIKAAKESGDLDALARATSKAEIAEVGRKWSRRSESAPAAKAMLEKLSTLPGVPVLPEAWDADLDLFNAWNGTVDTRTGESGPHNRAHLQRRAAPVPVKKMPIPVWTAFLLDVLGGDAEYVRYVQRVIGYCLTGHVTEQQLFVLFGEGANGKSTFTETILEMLGSYAGAGAPNLLMERQHEQHPTEIADLQGKRLVVCQENDAGQKLARGKVKRLTGGDLVKARHMNKDFGPEMVPTWKLLLAVNHLPEIPDADYGIWRRIVILPFVVRIPEERRDRNLREKLRAELPGILAWAVEGALEWRRIGLAAPAVVVEASNRYRAKMDAIAEFLEQRTTRGAQEHAFATPLFNEWAAWAALHEVDARGQTWFGRELTKRGYPPKTSNGIVFRQGLSIRESMH